MSPKEFLELVCKMRSAQKNYIRTRTYDDLDESKKLEREVDQAILDLSNPNKKPSYRLWPS